jgi:glycogen(starch) synthase
MSISLAPPNLKPLRVPKRILMTTDTVGGVWNYSIELTRALEKCATEVALAAMGPPVGAAQRREAASLSNLTLFESNFKLEWMNEPWEDVELAGRWLLELEGRVRPDLVHLNGYSHAKLDWRAPRIVVAHSCVLSWWSAVRNEPAPAQWNRYCGEVSAGLQAADAVVAPTKAMLSSLRHNYQWSGRGYVVPNGRSAETFAPAPKQHFVLCAGRLWDEAKNLALVGRAAQRLPWPVYAAGDGSHPEGGVVEAPHVRLLGKLPPQALAHWMASAAIFIAPARYEPFGLSILEAALSGCALILGDIPSLRELWDGAALFVHPDDPEQLIRASETLVLRPKHSDQMGKQARIRALRFSPMRMLDGYLEVYSQFIEGNVESTREIASCK